MRGDDKVVPAMVELAKKRSEGVEDFDYMIGHTNIPQKDDLIKACRKAFGKDPLITLPAGRRCFRQHRPRYHCSGLRWPRTLSFF